MTAVDFRDGEWGQVMFFMIWCEYNLEDTVAWSLFFAFYKYRVFFHAFTNRWGGRKHQSWTGRSSRTLLARRTSWDSGGLQPFEMMFKRHNSECSKHFPISETSYPTLPSQLELGQTLWKSRPSSRGAKRPGGDDKSQIVLKRQIKTWYSGRRCSSCSITFLISRLSSGAAHRTSTLQIFSTTWRQKGSKVFVRWNLLCDVHLVQTSCEVNFVVKMISREAWKAISPDIARLWKTCLPSQKSCDWCS